MIRLESVSYFYPGRDRAAVRDIDLAIESGTFLLLAGPSGSGKSTLLRLINGLVPHFSGGTIHGKVTVNGLDAVKAGPQALSKCVGFVAQNPESQSLLETVEPEIAFALENAAVPLAEMRERVAEVLQLLGLAPLRERAIRTLSGGERQRVAIASALAMAPDILLLDEPTSQLDPMGAEELLSYLRRLNRQRGLTVIVAEHRLERLLPHVQQVAYLDEGELVFHDEVQAALAALPDPPPLVEVANLLGWKPVPLTPAEARPYADALPERLMAKADGPAMPPHAAHAADSPPLLEVQEMHFAYDAGEVALAGVSFTLQEGKTVAILGQNGSGKSTLLKCLVGLLKPQQGEARLSGRTILSRDTADIARDIALLPQYPDDMLFAETVAEELEVTLRNHRIPVGDRVAVMLEELGLAEEGSSYPRDLSTGQRQRVALGAVTITRPRVLLLDEPTRGLDRTRKEALERLWQLWKSEGMGLVLATHDVELAVRLADTAMILDEGKIVAYGPVRTVLNGDSPFAPQIARLFPESGWLTLDEALGALPEAVDVPVSRTY